MQIENKFDYPILIYCMFLTKIYILTFVSIVLILFLAQVAPALSAPHINSNCFLVNKGYSQSPSYSMVAGW